jgi:exopolyphosphatase/guanosine-5'-triphosphate,3'-diphosphate pyrophosphatase
MRKAIIDLGTNTFQLLVVEQEGQDFQIIHEDSYAAKIGQGGISKGIITQEGIARAIVGLNYFKTILEKEDVIGKCKSYGNQCGTQCFKWSRVL